MYAPNPAASGSSVSHWDTALVPDQLMEPFDTGPKPAPGQLELALFQDLGWNLGVPTLTLQLNQNAFQLGQTMILGAMLTPGTPPMLVDAYVVIQLPDGSLFSLTGDGSFVPGVMPVVTSFTPVPFTGEVLRVTIDTGIPQGIYAWFCALTQPGTGNIIGSICQVLFTFNP
jgi:hypothetical protein